MQYIYICAGCSKNSKFVKQKQRVLASFGTEEMLYEPNIWLKLVEINLKMQYLAKYLGNVLENCSNDIPSNEIRIRRGPLVHIYNIIFSCFINLN